MSMRMEDGRGGTELSRRCHPHPAQEMDRDNRVVFLGEDIGRRRLQVDGWIYEKFGPLRVRDARFPTGNLGRMGRP